MDKPDKPTITNVLATVDLGCKIDLVKLVTHTRNTEFNPRDGAFGFDVVMMKLCDPKSTANIYSKGRLVITGTKGEKLARLAAMKCAKLIQLVGFPVEFSNFKVKNVAGVYDFKFPIRLEIFSSAYPDDAQYEPEIFPAVFYQMDEPRVKFCVHMSGNVTASGARSVEDLVTAFENLRPILQEFKKGNMRSQETDTESEGEGRGEENCPAKKNRKKKKKQRNV